MKAEFNLFYELKISLMIIRPLSLEVHRYVLTP